MAKAGVEPSSISSCEHAATQGPPPTGSLEARETATSKMPTVALTLLWLVVTATLVTMILTGVRQTDRFGDVRTALHITYVVVLLLYLVRTGPSTDILPELQPLLLRRWSVGRWLPAVFVALLLVLTVVSEGGYDIVFLVAAAATLLTLLVRFRQLRPHLFLQGLAAALVAYLAAIPYRNHGFISETAHVVMSALVPFVYVAGVLLIHRTGLGEVQLARGRFGAALRGFLWGCLLFVPLGLFNAADGSPGPGVDWVTRPWLPVLTPLFSGVAEEALFRLLLVPLVYLLLRPAFRARPGTAVSAALLFSAITFGIGHGRTFDAFFTTGLLYGLPMAVAFARRDWEHAIGGHYMVNMIPMVSVYFGL